MKSRSAPSTHTRNKSTGDRGGESKDGENREEKKGKIKVKESV